MSSGRHRWCSRPEEPRRGFRRFWPETLLGRVLALLLIAFLVAQVVTSVLHWRSMGQVVAGERGLQLALQLTSVLSEMEATAPDGRAALADSFRGGGMRVSWRPGTEPPFDPGQDWHLGPLKGALAQALGGIDESRIVLGWRSPEGGRREGRHGRWGPPWAGHDRDERHGPPWERRHRGSWRGAGLAVALALSDGSWVDVQTRITPFSVFGRYPSFWGPIVVTTVILLITVWGFRRTARPMATFAKAAERLGLDVNAPPLDERGPREVRRAASAFNEMQRRLQGVLRDRTQMLAAISHDLRTPITRMRLRAEFVEDDEQREKMLADLHEMEMMIAATLSFAKDDPAREPRGDLDLGALLAELCDDRGDKATYGGPAALAFTGRPMGLKRAFANLLDNAVKYGERARVGLVDAPDGVTVTIDDDGPGIPPESFEKVFEPFRRVDESRNAETGGTGLGLAVVRAVVRAHGGEVELANGTEGGLRVRVFLPRG